MKKFHIKQLFIAMLALTCSTVVNAHDFEVDGIFYNIISGDNASVTYKGQYSDSYTHDYKGNVVIPSTVNYNGKSYSVTSIRSGAFEDCTRLTSITIPNSVTSIGTSAFNDCSGLTSVTIPNSVTSIGNSAFYNCSRLTSVTIPNSVTSIGSRAFEGCTGLTVVHISDLSAWFKIDFDNISSNPLYYAENLYLNGEKVTDLVIPEGVTVIGISAFYNCSGLTSVTIPNSVTSIKENAFEGCTGLTSVHISDLSAWCKIDFNGYYSNPLYYAKNLYLDGEKVTDLVIPDGVTKIKDFAFPKCSNLTSARITNSVTSIGHSAFYDCTGLTNITIPNSVTSIVNSAFEGCTSLKDLRIEDGETTLSLWNDTYSSYDIGYGIFNGCPLETIYLGRNLSYNRIEYYDLYSPFYKKTTLKSVTIGNSVTSIGDYAFSGCTGLTSITIPNSVTSIKYSAFSGCSGLTEIIVSESNSVYNSRNNCNAIIETVTNKLVRGCVNTVIPEDVTSIGENAFSGCTGLTNITIPNSVTSIGNSTFYNCSNLTEITIPNSVTSIGNSTFYNCSNLTEITIPNSVTSIGSWAFSGCTGLTNITIPNSVTSIESLAFEGCSKLTSIIMEDGNTELRFVPSYGLTNVGLFHDCPLKTIYLGRNLSYSTDKSEGYSPFYKKPTLKSVTIGNNVTSIGDYAFYGCTGLTSITIPNSVTIIEHSAFYNCSGLKTVYNFSNITLTKGSTNYGYIAYYADKLINAPNGSVVGDFVFGEIDGANTLVEYIGNDSIIILPDENKCDNYVIGNNVFKDYNLTSITIPSNVTNIKASAFEGCTGLKTVYNFSNITLTKGSTNYGYIAYYADKLINAPNGSVEGDFVFSKISGVNTLTEYLGSDTAIILPDNCNGESYTIGNNLFKKYHLTSITIPNSVTSIGDYAFYYCDSLKSITIGNSVTSIGEWAFWGCYGLTDIHISDISAWCKIDFDDTSSNPFSHSLAKNLYLNGEKVTNLVIPEGVTKIKDYAFYDCDGLTGVTIPESVTSIGSRAFGACNGLTSVTIPNSVTVIGESAFTSCNGLTSVTIGNGVTSIGSGAFYECDYLKDVHINDISAWCKIDFIDGYSNPLSSRLYLNGEEVSDLVIPEDVTEIKKYTFSGCKSLTSITIPNNVKSIGRMAFSGCSGLTSATISKSITSIEDYTFSGCSGLTSITIPNRVTNIGKYAFYGCSGLTSITIPNRVTSIGENAFSDCSGLTEIIVSESNSVYDSRNNCNAIIETATNKLVRGCVNSVIPEDVTSIGEYAFCGCTGLTDIDIPDCITVIESGVFKDCSSLKSVTIPKNVATIEYNAFYGCSELTSIYLENGTPATIDDEVFTESQYFDITLYVPKGTLNNYLTADGWSKFYDILEWVPTAIKNTTEEDAPAFEISGSGIQLTAAEGKMVAVYSMSGALVEKIDAYAGEEITLEKGVYIIRVGGKTVKVKL